MTLYQFCYLSVSVEVEPYLVGNNWVCLYACMLSRLILYDRLIYECIFTCEHNDHFRCMNEENGTDSACTYVTMYNVDGVCNEECYRRPI